MEPLEYTVQRIPVERTLALRQAVLRPYLGEERFILDDDRLPTTVAFGAVTPDDRVIAVARLTPERPPFDAPPLDEPDRPAWRLRGMATSPDARNLGVGADLLQALVGHLVASGGGVLWCNARLPATRFYERGGMEAWGEPWDEPEIGPHVVMWPRRAWGARASVGEGDTRCPSRQLTAQDSPGAASGSESQQG